MSSDPSTAAATAHPTGCPSGPTMHCSSYFAETDDKALLSFVESTVLGSIVTATPAEGILVNQIPFTLHRPSPQQQQEGGKAKATLQCHFPAQNADQLRALLSAHETGAQVVIAFNGPHHYISANWFSTKAESHLVVPTWNYATVNASCVVRRVTMASEEGFAGDCAAIRKGITPSSSSDAAVSATFASNAEHRAFLRAHLAALTARCEALVSEAVPWTLDDAPPAFIDGLCGQLVGMELSIERLEGKVKASQNKKRDAPGIIEGLGRLAECPHMYAAPEGANGMCAAASKRLAEVGTLATSSSSSSKKAVAKPSGPAAGLLTNVYVLWAVIAVLMALLVGMQAL